jgi:GntR family transcriptional regulator / MocR family aminotransferase
MQRVVKTSNLIAVAAKLGAQDKGTLQRQIREKVIDAILTGVYPPGRRLPSSRKLSKQLGVARNTVALAYQQLVAEGYVVSRERSGLYVKEREAKGPLRFERVGGPAEQTPATEWIHRFKSHGPSGEVYRFSPDWQKYPFPFVEGRFDRSLFPVAEWREASRLALSVREIEQWSTDTGDADDPMLVEQIRTKVLPRRGINARADEILITLGTQQALYLTAELFSDRTTRVAVEEPGNASMREMFAKRGATIFHQPVDEDGIVVDDWLNMCRVVYVTPSHQRPTAVTLSVARRQALLEKANEHDFVIIEDDFECETNYLDDAHPALRGMSGGDRVIYVANLSRVLSPSLRLGFLVAAPDVVSEARRLRALFTRHPPLNNQRMVALFLSLGHYDTTMLRLGRVFRERMIALRDALNHYRPHSIAIAPVRGGTTYWVRGPEGLNVHDLARHAEARGVLIEPVDHYYASASGPPNVFRMGITGIPVASIRGGVALLAEIIREITAVDASGTDGRSTQWLKPTTLRKALAGATLLYKTVYGDPCTIELHEDGSMSGRAGYANEDNDRGRWWIEKDRWCRQWNNWAYGEVARFHTRIDQDHIKWFNDEGCMVDSAVLVPPPNKRSRSRR